MTVIRARPFEDEAQATEWLDRVRAERELWEPLAAEAAAIVNRALHAHRTATGDPYVADVDPARALALRFGFGTGEEVAEGRWRSAAELDLRPGSSRGRDDDALRPQERVAAVLGGRERVAPYEELILRARADLDAGRLGSAALGLHAALEAIRSLTEASLARQEPDADPPKSSPARQEPDADPPKSSPARGEPGDDRGRESGRPDPAALTEPASAARRARRSVLEGGEPDRDTLEAALRATEAALRRARP